MNKILTLILTLFVICSFTLVASARPDDDHHGMVKIWIPGYFEHNGHFVHGHYIWIELNERQKYREEERKHREDDRHREAPRREEPRREAPHHEEPHKEAPHHEEPHKEVPHKEEPHKEVPHKEVPPVMK